MAKFKRGNLDLKTNQKIRLGDNLESNIRFDGTTLRTAVNGTDILALTDESQIIGVAGSDVNIVLDQDADNISMYMDAGEGQGYSQVVDIDGDDGNSEINIGLQTEVYLKIGIGSSPNIRMLSGSDTWFYVDPSEQRLGNTAAGESNIEVNSTRIFMNGVPSDTTTRTLLWDMNGAANILYAGDQTQLHTRLGIGSSPSFRVMSGTDTWLYVDVDDQRLGNNAAGGSSFRVESAGDISAYAYGTQLLHSDDEIMTIGDPAGVRIKVDYDDDQVIEFYGAVGGYQLRVGSTGIRLDYGSVVNQFSNDTDSNDDANSDADEKIWTVQAASRHLQQTMSHNFMEPQTINRRSGESLKYGLGVDYLSYSVFSRTEVNTTESKENVMVALQNGRGMLVFIDNTDSIKYRLVNETGTSFVGSEGTIITASPGPYQDLGASLLPNGNVVITALDAEFAPFNGTVRYAIIDQDGNIVVDMSSTVLMTVDQYVAPPAVTTGGNWISVGQQGTGHVSGQIEYEVVDQEGNVQTSESSLAVANVGSVTSAGLVDNTFMIFFSDSTGNNFYKIDRFGNVLQSQTYLGGHSIASQPKAFTMNNGNVFLSYLSGSGTAYFQIITPSGEIRKTETQISSGTVTYHVAQQFSGGDIIILYEYSNQYYYQVRDLSGDVVVAETLSEADDFENANSMTQFNSGQIVVAFWDGTNRVLEAWAPNNIEFNNATVGAGGGSSGLLIPQEIYNNSVVALRGSTKIDVLDWEVKVAETSVYIGTQSTRGAATNLVNGKVMTASLDSASGVGEFAIIDSLGNIDTTASNFTSSSASNPRLATLMDGRVVFAYTIGVSGYFQVRDQEGNLSISETDFTPSGFGDLYSTIDVTQLLDGGFAIAFTDDSDDPWIKFFNADGSTRKEGFNVSTSSISEGGTGKVLTLPNGNVAVVLSSDSGSLRIYDSQGTLVESVTSISSSLPDPGAEVLANGNIFIVSDNKYFIYDFNANLVLGETVFGTATSRRGVLPLPNGDALIYYIDASDIGYAIYSADGTQVKTQTALRSSTGYTLNSNMGAVFTNGNVFISYYETAATELHCQILQGTGTSIASDLEVEGSGDFERMAVGNVDPNSAVTLFINEDFNSASAVYGAYVGVENLANDAGPGNSTTGVRALVQNNTSTLANEIYGGSFVVNPTADGVTVTKLVGVEGSATCPADNGTITDMLGAEMRVNTGFSMTNLQVTNMIAGQFTILESGSGDVDVTNGYGALIKTPGYTPSGTLTNLYGLYVEDQSTVGFTTDYNLYSAGVNSKNKIEGILEVDNIDSTALVVTGDIYCDDLHVSGDTIFVGTGEIKSTGGNIELSYAGSKVVETTASGLDNPKTDITITGKTGWDYEDRNDLIISFDSTAMEFAISSSGGSYEFWVQGVKYTKTGEETVSITDTEGEWYFTYNTSGVLTASQTPWEIDAEDAVLIANGYWDATNKEMNILGVEFHSYSMPSATHYHLHEVVGTLYEEGLGITDNADGTLDISGGELHDEDVKITITDELGSGFWDQVLSPAELPIYYKDGASGNWRRVYNGTSPTYFAYQNEGGNPYWNQFTGGAWQLTPSANNNNTAWWIIATNNIDEPVVVVMGQGAPNNTESTAIANNPINSLDLGDFGAQEYKILYRVMVQNAGAPYTTATITDFRTAQSVGGTGPTVNDHGALNGLSDDDHPQYSLVDGSRDFTGTVGGIDPVADTDFTTKNYVDTNTGAFGVTLGDAQKIEYDPTPSADETGTGDVISVTVATNTYGVAGILTIDSTSGEWIDADLTSEATVGILAMAVESGTGTKQVMVRGIMRDDSWAWTPNDQLYIGNNGAITNVAAGSGEFLQVVGYALTATTVYFNPSPNYAEVS